MALRRGGDRHAGLLSCPAGRDPREFRGVAAYPIVGRELSREGEDRRDCSCDIHTCDLGSDLLLGTPGAAESHDDGTCPFLDAGTRLFLIR